MLVWINGTFGVGKTTTAAAVVSRSGRRVFDPEQVGYMLMANLHGIKVTDFQDLAAWRQLVPIVARHVAGTSGQQLVAVQTVLDQRYWSELRQGLISEELGVMHVVLDADPQALVRRIHADQQERAAVQWRLDHVETYLAARRWILDDADLVIDVSEMSADDAADRIVRELP